jgi:hypothetical protein
MIRSNDLPKARAGRPRAQFTFFVYMIYAGALLGWGAIGLAAQNFSPATYKGGSKTGGIQEAIDAAAKAGGGTVQIPAGTYVLQAISGHPAILLRSKVNVTGAGASSTILKLEPNSKAQPAVIANENWANPDGAEADHDITLQGFTLDATASDQVVRETQLTAAIPMTGLHEVGLRAAEGVGVDAVIRVDPGPNEEIVPVMSASSGTLKAFLMHTHAAGAKVVVLTERLHGVALVGASGVTLEDVTIENVPMDGVYLTSTVTPNAAYHTYSKKINIHHSNFIACHRNGISVIDADDVMIADNNFRDITGDPGAPVDIEPNHPENHGNRITIRDNQVSRCYRGMSIALGLGGPTSANFRDEVITGNKISATLYGWGVYVGNQRAGAVVSHNTIADTAGEGVFVLGSSGVQVTDNEIIAPGRCHTQGAGNPNCEKPASGIGVRLADDTHTQQELTGDTVTGNTIKDDQQRPTLLYGVEFASKGRGNSIQKNVVSHLDPAHGMVLHGAENAGSNTISGNVKQ